MDICFIYHPFSPMSPGENHSDADLVAALVAGNRKAFEIIYRKYARALLNFARKNISIPEECEEIVQEVFVSIWSRRSTLKIQCLRVYLFSMVRYMTVKYFQHNSVRKRYAEHYLIFEALYEEMDESAFDEKEMQAMIEQSLTKLPERCGTAIRLRLYENLSNAEIAARMKVTKKTVENYVVMFTAHFRKTHNTSQKVSMKMAMVYLSFFL
ncbi:MAG: hypothetical protein C0490_12590 [Marivirga sp.]|nr:hypothetical protein [Marivirga sp.]